MNRTGGLAGPLLFVMGWGGVGCTADEARLLGGRQDEVGAVGDANTDQEASRHDASYPDVLARDVTNERHVEAGADAVLEARNDAAVEACVPAASGEICNGEDDDCDGVADEGCPDRIVLSPGRDGPLLGLSMGGTFVPGACGDGNVLIGYHVLATGYVTELSDECATISLKVDTSARPFGYTIRIDSPMSVNAWGSPDATTAEQRAICPEDYALTGLAITQPSQVGYDVLTSMTVQCTKLAIVPSAGSYVVQTADVITLPAAKGAIYRATDSGGSDNAPPGHLATATSCSAGAWIDRIGFSDAVVTVHTIGAP